MEEADPISILGLSGQDAEEQQQQPPSSSSSGTMKMEPTTEEHEMMLMHEEVTIEDDDEEPEQSSTSLPSCRVVLERLSKSEIDTSLSPPKKKHPRGGKVIRIGKKKKKSNQKTTPNSLRDEKGRLISNKATFSKLGRKRDTSSAKKKLSNSSNTCAVATCRSPAGVSYFTFPAASDLRTKWIEACGRKQDIGSHANLRMCAQHFAPHCFVRDFQNELMNLPVRVRIDKDSAVPTLKLRGQLSKTCAVATCHSPDDVSYLRFPTDKILRAKWIEACGREDDISCQINPRICVEHFAPDCFVRDLQNELLNLPLRVIVDKTKAMPTLKLGREEKEEEETSSRARRAKSKLTAEKGLVPPPTPIVPPAPKISCRRCKWCIGGESTTSCDPTPVEIILAAQTPVQLQQFSSSPQQRPAAAFSIYQKAQEERRLATMINDRLRSKELETMIPGLLEVIRKEKEWLANYCQEKAELINSPAEEIDDDDESSSFSSKERRDAKTLIDTQVKKVQSMESRLSHLTTEQVNLRRRNPSKNLVTTLEDMLRERIVTEAQEKCRLQKRVQILEKEAGKSNKSNKAKCSEGERWVRSKCTEMQYRFLLDKEPEKKEGGIGLWEEAEVVNALLLRAISKKAYSFVRLKRMMPLPGLFSLRAWAKVLNLNDVGDIKVFRDDETEEAKLLIPDPETVNQNSYLGPRQQRSIDIKEEQLVEKAISARKRPAEKKLVNQQFNPPVKVARLGEGTSSGVIMRKVSSSPKKKNVMSETEAAVNSIQIVEDTKLFTNDDVREILEQELGIQGTDGTARRKKTELDDQTGLIEERSVMVDDDVVVGRTALSSNWKPVVSAPPQISSMFFAPSTSDATTTFEAANKTTTTIVTVPTGEARSSTIQKVENNPTLSSSSSVSGIVPKSSPDVISLAPDAMKEIEDLVRRAMTKDQPVAPILVPTVIDGKTTHLVLMPVNRQ